MADGERPARVGLLAPMPSEFQPLVKALALQRTGAEYTGSAGVIELVAAKTGIGTRLAAEATERLLDAAAVDHVMVVGIAGGMGPSRVGDLVFPEVVVDKASGAEYRPSPLGPVRSSGRLVTHDDFDMQPAERDALVGDGFVAVDMETAAVAGVRERRGVRWSRGAGDQRTPSAPGPARAPGRAGEPRPGAHPTGGERRLDDLLRSEERAPAPNGRRSTGGSSRELRELRTHIAQLERSLGRKAFEADNAEWLRNETEAAREHEDDVEDSGSS